MATVGVTEQPNAFATDDNSRRGGKRKRDNQFDSDTSPATRRQTSRTQQYPPTANMTSTPDPQQHQQPGDGMADPSSMGNSHHHHHHHHFSADNLPPAPSENTHQSNNQFDISSLGDPAHAGPTNPAAAAASNSAAVAAAGQATAAAALHSDFSMNVPPHPGSGFGDMPTAGQDDSFLAADLGGDPTAAGGTPNKPAVGSEEWHKVRKDNHKEVERRRRETINEGINELAKIVPGCEKNKGSILARAVQYIQKLQEDASTNIDKWTFEKLVTEQAINELSEKVTKTYREKEAWKRVAKEAGVDVDGIDLGLPEDSQDGGIGNVPGVGEANMHGVPVGGEQNAMRAGDEGKDGQGL